MVEHLLKKEKYWSISFIDFEDGTGYLEITFDLEHGTPEIFSILKNIMEENDRPLPGWICDYCKFHYANQKFTIRCIKNLIIV